MATRVASLRGSPIACFGSAGLVRRDAAGRKRWLMQADQVLFLHPERVRWRRALDVDTDPLPDVVLEVDHRTDVRRRKLGIYMESGFPEIWVVVPWESSRRAPGLSIHVRRGGRYREEAESRAFPGVEEGGPLRGADRDSLVGGDGTRAGAGGARDGRARGHEARGRPFHPLGEREGAGGRPRRGAGRRVTRRATREALPRAGKKAATRAGRRSVRRTCARCSRRGASRRPWTAQRTGRSSAPSRSGP